ncbi:hypothetical protein DNHGIG_20490 [Collibacillus ludicampi]|uniref:Uncharacterized protein n=1 Tax=Collibacillus ludicampi TaxID=2771369 RepID=A0AAV4LFD5_9BACL|nr:hypothetical protein [Collibacillus ludicampi]GIM46500.1 hypothetical protein DNHGIG_20490 [Collibacillus ludicampi]
MRYLETIQVLTKEELIRLTSKIHSLETEANQRESNIVQEEDASLPKEVILDYRFQYLREQLNKRKKQNIGFLAKIIHK